MLLSSMTLCMALMSSPMPLPPQTALALAATQMDGGSELEDCLNRAWRNYARAGRECQQNLYRELTRCSYMRDPRRSSACSSRAYYSYQKCTTWAQQTFEKDYLNCLNGGGGPMEPCKECPEIR